MRVDTTGTVGGPRIKTQEELLVELAEAREKHWASLRSFKKAADAYQEALTGLEKASEAMEKAQKALFADIESCTRPDGESPEVHPVLLAKAKEVQQAAIKEAAERNARTVKWDVKKPTYSPYVDEDDAEVEDPD